MSTREVGGMTFSYETHGEGTPVVFLHGIPTDRRSMVPRYEPLFARADGPRGFRRIYLDSPGMGETPASPSITNLDQYVEAVGSFLEAETGGEPFALAGTSFGAHLAQAYTLLHPERLAGLAMFVPSYGPRASIRPEKTALFTEPGVLDGVPEPLAGAFANAATVHSKAVLDAIATSVAPGGKIADHAFLRPVVKEPLSYAERLNHMTYGGPVLIVAGRQDAMCGYVEAWPIAEQFPRATFAVLDRAGHAMQIEQNKLLHALFGEWLARVREGLGGSYEG
jgi:pimeloyl-ACP methyl ester carboxylesterase